MTFEERAALKRLIDQAIRSKLAPVCDECGEEFRQAQPNQRFCSATCRRTAEWARARMVAA